MSKSKTANTVKSEVPEIDKQSTGAGVFARLYWMMLGNLALVITAIAIFHKQPGFGAAEVFYCAILISVILVRYIDITRLDGCTASGEPANIHHWQKYTVFMITISAIILVVAQFPRLLGK